MSLVEASRGKSQRELGGVGLTRRLIVSIGPMMDKPTGKSTCAPEPMPVLLYEARRSYSREAMAAGVLRECRQEDSVKRSCAADRSDERAEAPDLVQKRRQAHAGGGLDTRILMRLNRGAAGF